MQSSARRYLIGSLLALGAVLLASLLLLWLLNAPLHRRLRDGSRLSLASVSYGKEHVVTQSELERARGHLIPSLTAFEFDRTTATPTDALVVWTVRRGGNVGANDLRLNGFVTDEHGCWLRDAHWSASGGDGEEIQSTRFDNFPRRRPFVQIGWVDEKGMGSLATFTVPNPVQQDYPLWVGEPLPVRRRSGSVEYTLSRLHHDETGRDCRDLAYFQVRTMGKLDPNWRPLSVTVQDATGNLVTTEVSGWNYNEGEVRFSGLCRQETAWKMTVVFKQAPEGKLRKIVEFLVDPRSQSTP